MPNKQYFETRICPKCKTDYFLVEKNICAGGGYPKSNTLWYLAHPYIKDRSRNFAETCRLSVILLNRGIAHINPIAMTHPIHLSQPHGMSEKEEYDLYLMFLDKILCERCDGLILCEGWEQSKGCLIEKEWFESWGKPIKYLSRHGNFISRDVTRGDEHE